MHPLDPARLDLAREFRQRPLGPHSPDLQRLLKVLRWDSVTDRFIVVQRVRGGPWSVARATGPKGQPIEFFDTGAYATSQDAWWEIFRRRWQRHTGVPLELPEDGSGQAPLAEVGNLEAAASRYPILGYADRFSVRPGEAIAFKISAASDYRVAMERLRCGDHAGVGFKSRPVPSTADGVRPGRLQEAVCGSWVEIPDADRAFELPSFTLAARIWPTAPASGRWQALLGNGSVMDRVGFLLGIDADGCLAVRLGDGSGDTAELSTGRPLLERHWYLAVASFDAPSGALWVCQHALHRYHDRGDSSADARRTTTLRPAGGRGFRIAAAFGARLAEDSGESFGGFRPDALYNGKIDGPLVLSRPLSTHEQGAVLSHGTCPGGDPVSDPATIAAWDFSQEIPTTRIVDRSTHRRHGRTINLPTRAMTGWNWDGSEYHWQHRPEHYGAIHFHDDDLYDCHWKTDFSLEIPRDWHSGLYAARLSPVTGEAQDEDWIPFVVSPPVGKANAPLALLLPSASYWAYANTHHVIEAREGELIRANFTTVDATTLFLHEHPEFGCSMYDRHSDGSGVCLSSRLRPVLTIRPRERLWQLPADTHIIDWLEGTGIACDIITEDDLDQHGVALLAPYRCVMTGTHPEYPSKRMMDAYRAYQSQGGRFIYLGGNGFYWRTVYHPTLPGVIEMRRTEDGLRTWFAEPGEYYHAFTGEMGGMWRRMGQAPQTIAGAGMTAQGFDRSTHYRRLPASFDPRAAFIFEGIGAAERIGDFGRIGGGAAGWEIDRADVRLGTPPHALVVATADTFGDAYHWMTEEQTHTHAAITGETCPHVHCDMVFYETPNGGAVFSTSSIAWAGALSHADYENNVSRITANVVRRFIDPAPFDAPG